MKSKRAFAILLSLVLLFAFCISCKKSNKKPSDKPEDSNLGTHIYNVEKTSNYIVNEGNSEYRIIIPKNSTEEHKKAAEELVYFLKEISGAELIIDNDSNYDSNSKYISIGNNELYRCSSIYNLEENYYDKLGQDGFMIKTDGNNVYIIASARGCIFGVYELLHQLADYQYYSKDEIYFQKLSNINFYKLDVIDIPDFDYRMVLQGFQKSDYYRYRMNMLEDVWANRNIYCHNTLKYIPIETYAKSHPKWFSDKMDQLCYNAHGDEEELTALINLVAEKLISVLDSSEYDILGFTQMDNKHSCECDECINEFSEYGTPVAGVVKFCNRLAENIRTHYKNVDKERKFKIVFFAYEAYEMAPVKIENNETIPINNDIICDPDVSVCYAPISVKYNIPLDSKEFDNYNMIYYKNILDWQKLCNNVFMWVYSTNFSHYLVPYNVFDSMQNNYCLLKKLNVKYLSDQGQFNVSQSTAWTNLIGYLQSQLQWNCCLDFENLLNNYFTHYFKDAATPMRELFDLQLNRMREIQKEKLADGSIYENSETIKCYPKEFLINCLNKIEEAYSSIPEDKYELELYNKLIKRIQLEAISYKFLYVKLYNESYGNQDLYTFKNSLKSEINYFGLKYSEHINFEESILD